MEKMRLAWKPWTKPSGFWAALKTALARSPWTETALAAARAVPEAAPMTMPSERMALAMLAATPRCSAGTEPMSALLFAGPKAAFPKASRKSGRRICQLAICEPKSSINP